MFEDFGRHEHRAMVAAALDLLATFADSEEARRVILAPWAWDLRQTARRLEGQGARGAAAEAKAIARIVSAAALGEVTSAELARAASAIEVDAQERLAAAGVLRIAMNA